MSNLIRRATAALRFLRTLSKVHPVSRFRVAHEGMGFPIGSVLPESAFSGGVEGHVALKALIPTRDPVNVDLPDAIQAQGKPDGAEVNWEKALDKAREQQLQQAGKIAELEKKLATTVDELAEVRAELAKVTKDRDAALQLAESHESHRLQTAPLG